MSEQEPLFKLVRGTPTPDELAALVGVVLTRSRPVPSSTPPVSSAWSRSGRPGAVSHSGMPARSGPDGWRSSALPR